MFLAGAETGSWTQTGDTLKSENVRMMMLMVYAPRSIPHTHIHTFAGHTFLWPNKNVPSEKREISDLSSHKAVKLN